MSRPKTPNRGAADIIAQVIAKARREMKKQEREGAGLYIHGESFIAWLRDWDKRAAKKAGGLGRK